MARWTSNINDIRKLSELPDFVRLWGFKQARIILVGGVQSIEGIVLPARAGNNAGAGGTWMYYGTVAIRTASEDIEIDFRDVERAELLTV